MRVKNIKLPHVVFFILLLVALSGLISSAIALLLGFVFRGFFAHPFPKPTSTATKQLLKIAVIGLGFGVTWQQALAANAQGIGVLSLSVIFTVIGGIALALLLRVERKLGFLITSGTTICGGSAIAAVSPTIQADNKATSIALAVVFALNALALLIFPYLGQWLGLNQQQFGLWAAIAIHDTSSVVGAAMAYGDEALHVATTLKLSRTLWIIPLAIFAGFWFRNKGQAITLPYFIVGFVLAMWINSSQLLPVAVTGFIVEMAKHVLIGVLFLIGTTLSIADLKTVGFKPLLLAVILWLLISLLSLLAILS